MTALIPSASPSKRQDGGVPLWDHIKISSNPNLSVIVRLGSRAY